MKKLIPFLLIASAWVSCHESPGPVSPAKNTVLADLFEEYHEESLRLFPLNATFEGDDRYNDKLTIEFTDSFRDQLRRVYANYLDRLAKLNREKLNDEDQLSYDIFQYTLQLNLEGLKFHDNYLPINQFSSLTLTMGQFASGGNAQPFNTVEDYEKWARRVEAFGSWADSAIVYMKRGIASGIVLPRALVIKVIPELQEMVTAKDAVQQNLFFSPAKKFPASFSQQDQQRLTGEYVRLVNEKVVPVYRKLADFMKNDYLPQARATSGIGALPDGDAWYRYLVRQQTTTGLSPDEIYSTGLAEVKRIRGIMDSVKNAAGFSGSLQAFFQYMRTDKKFMPFTSPEQVLDAFRAIQRKIQPNLDKMFGRVPKTAFEIRQTEAFRAASASAEYNQGSADGKRPGIFYIPIVDATKFNTTSGMESLFLHEAIPGHHYQLSLQQEDTTLPRFRRFGLLNAYAEGWALYCESLGKELGLYTDPYQYMGALGDEIHRAIRLVVDVGIHAKGMTREQAIQYMMENEAISLDGATAEIERYMAIPGQALGYKIGALKIRELRTRYEKQLGTRFNLASFHDQILRLGSVPLAILEKAMDEWAKRQK